jgi:hypothetical protein
MSFIDTCQRLTQTYLPDIDPLVRFRLARPFGGHKAPHLSTHPCHKSTGPKVRATRNIHELISSLVVRRIHRSHVEYISPVEYMRLGMYSSDLI